MTTLAANVSSRFYDGKVSRTNPYHIPTLAASVWSRPHENTTQTTTSQHYCLLSDPYLVTAWYVGATNTVWQHWRLVFDPELVTSSSTYKVWSEKCENASKRGSVKRSVIETAILYVTASKGDRLWSAIPHTTTHPVPSVMEACIWVPTHLPGLQKSLRKNHWRRVCMGTSICKRTN